jgi:hypothetical protein
MTIKILFSLLASLVGIAGSLPYLWNTLVQKKNYVAFVRKNV